MRCAQQNDVQQSRRSKISNAWTIETETLMGVVENEIRIFRPLFMCLINRRATNVGALRRKGKKDFTATIPPSILRSLERIKKRSSPLNTYSRYL